MSFQYFFYFCQIVLFYLKKGVNIILTMTHYKNTVDMHIHSDNSFDGNDSCIYMCETAMKKDVRAVAFCDHCEIDIFRQGNFARSVRQAYFEVAKARSAFRGSLAVMNGIELGQPIYDLPTAEKVLASQKFDVVIGSIHNLPDKEDFYYTHDYDRIDTDAMLKEYFTQILKMTEWGRINVIAHLTYPLRYLYEYNGIEPDLKKFADITDAIFREAAKRDIALEINTSGLRQPIDKLLPELSLVKRFRELGGKLISIGSDAHYAMHIGVGIKQAYDCALEAGFDAVTIFTGGRPNELPIE